MIFRRRTTDQVYATLQQVQRRITEQGGPGPAPASPTVRGPGTATFRSGAGTTPMRTPPPGSLNPAQRRDTPMPGEPTQAPYPVAHPTFPAPGPARGTLELPTQMAVTLMLVWLTTLVAAFLIGRFSAPTGPELAPAPVAANGKPQDPETPSNRRQGDAIFVLKAIPRFTDVQKAAWQKEVDRLNALCRTNAAKGWKDYFALREPENGGLEFVFGYVNGQFGIDQKPFRDFAALLQKPTDKGGAGYVSATWKTLE